MQIINAIAQIILFKFYGYFYAMLNQGDFALLDYVRNYSQGSTISRADLFTFISSIHFPVQNANGLIEHYCKIGLMEYVPDIDSYKVTSPESALLPDGPNQQLGNKLEGLDNKNNWAAGNLWAILIALISSIILGYIILD